MTTQKPLQTAKRPVNLDLSTIKQPLPALVSISHRITGVMLFVGLIFALWAFDASLSSERGFEAVRDALAHNFFAKLVAWGLLSALALHFVAGIRHMAMDLHFADDREGGIRTSKIVIIASAVLILLAGVWVW
ncbi:succinate dehydrogenase, cytochrome b556 subunit [Halotalea alkalilenta]|uniref:Succinate dehydrogenase cytochrome b556 subunit n=1 Tax=Halotalea alkalilenta TaxID=376489 RepID=A0A172YGZ3_9GAMM|nr:succinate dehydrogenase, cytochrome b556 subunit [Halotalea alkalilenta]ANF58504.1 succinate dehydrogenase, cytochrome b556 subunit [Halotalea alkalilenta]